MTTAQITALEKFLLPQVWTDVIDLFIEICMEKQNDSGFYIYLKLKQQILEL